MKFNSPLVVFVHPTQPNMAVIKAAAANNGMDVVISANVPEGKALVANVAALDLYPPIEGDPQ